MESVMHIRKYTHDDLAGVLRLCEQEGWPTLVADPARAQRALSAPGVTTVVAEDRDEIIGFVQLQSDGEIQAHLSLIAVTSEYRRKGVAREMIVVALRQAGGLRIDLVTESADDFYGSLPHLRLAGYRLYPEYSGPDRYRPEIHWRGGRKSTR
jgi:ribosomal protein S18 acetylase RimI-like enzyme